MNILNPFSSQYHACADLVKHYNEKYTVNVTNGSVTTSARAGSSKALVIAKTIAILMLSIALFPVGAAIFRSLVNRMTLQKANLTYEDGGTFQGMIKFDKMYRGKSVYNDGVTSEGTFDDNGTLYGKGKMTFLKPKQFTQKDTHYLVSTEGQFTNGMLNGKGKEVWKSTDDQTTLVYECEYKDGSRTGFGTRTDDGKLRYKGEWLEGDYHGFGELNCPDGSKFTGVFAEGKFARGTRVYKGTWDINDNFTSDAK